MDDRNWPIVAALLSVAFVVGFFILQRSGSSSPNMSDEESEASPATESKAGKPFDSKHYAWAKDIKQRADELAALGVDMTPKPIQVESAGTVASKGSGSAWNAAGTWEDRDVSVRAIQLLRESLGCFVATVPGGLSLSFSAVTSCTGTATIM
jgi:hypothetical protein